MADTILANADEVAAKTMDGESVLIHLGTGIYYSLDDVAGCIWQAVEQGCSLQDIISRVTGQFDVSAEEAAEDVARIVGTLQEENLAKASDQASAGAGETVAQRTPYATPMIEKFDDMAEMFALDPPLPGLAQRKS